MDCWITLNSAVKQKGVDSCSLPVSTVHCPKYNPNLRIKTEPVTAGADATFYMSGFCFHVFGSKTRHVTLQNQLCIIIIIIISVIYADI